MGDFLAHRQAPPLCPFGQVRGRLYSAIKGLPANANASASASEGEGAGAEAIVMTPLRKAAP